MPPAQWLPYATLKLVHVSAVSVSFAGFVARGIGAIRGSDWVRQRLVRVLPHLVDSILLLSALGMLWVLQLAPWSLPWLRAKLIGLVCYILLGVLVLRPRIGTGALTPRVVRLGCWLAALSVFGYIVSVALTKDPRGLWALLR